MAARYFHDLVLRSISHSATLSVTHPLFYPFVQAGVHSLTHPFINFFGHPFIHSIFSYACLSIHSFSQIRSGPSFGHCCVQPCQIALHMHPPEVCRCFCSENCTSWKRCEAADMVTKSVLDIEAVIALALHAQASPSHFTRRRSSSVNSLSVCLSFFRLSSCLDVCLSLGLISAALI